MTASRLVRCRLGIGPVRTGNMPKVAKKKALKRTQSSRNAVSKRLCSKADAQDLPVVKFKVEQLELGNKACCCFIGK